MPNSIRTVAPLQKLDLVSINRALRDINLNINALQGRLGPVTTEDSLTVDGTLTVGDAVVSSNGELVAKVGGFASRPLAPWIPHAKVLTEGTDTQIVSLKPDTATSHTSFGALIYYNILAHQDAFALRVQSETGLVTCTGVSNQAGTITSGLSAVGAASQAIGAGTLTNTFTSALSSDGESLVLSVNANSNFAASVEILFWIWPFMCTPTLL